MKLIPFLLLSLSLVMSFVVDAQTAYEATGCRFVTTIENVDCGDLLVPEDYTRDNSPMIRIHVATIRARQQPILPDPIVYLAGGPGSHTLQSLDNLQVFSELYRNRDMIIIDQRGVGMSLPALDCPEISTHEEEMMTSTASHEAIQQTYLEAVQECRDRLVAEGIDLSAYNTDFSARDVEELRQALGYDQWNILATSYGTSLAQTIIRDYHDGVRSVILDSPLALGSSWVLNASTLAESAFERWLTACIEANPECANLETTLFELVEEWNENPQAITGNFYGTSFETVLDGDELLTNIFWGLTNQQSLIDLPYALNQAKQGNYAPIAVYDLYQLWNTYGFSFGMNFAVLCADIASREPIASDSLRFSSMFGVGSVLAVCDIWNVPPRPDATPLSINNIPTLILYGEFDPLLDPSTVAPIAQYFENKHTFELPNHSHLVSYSSTCARQLMGDFLNNPLIELSSECMELMELLDFMWE